MLSNIQGHSQNLTEACTVLLGGHNWIATSPPRWHLTPPVGAQAFRVHEPSRDSRSHRSRMLYKPEVGSRDGVETGVCVLELRMFEKDILESRKGRCSHKHSFSTAIPL